MSATSETRSTRTDSLLAALRAVLGVPFRPSTYGNLAYLALQFPLSLAYFTALVTLLALGVGLSIVGVGLLLLVGTLLAVTAVAHVEVVLADALLSVDVTGRRTAFDVEDGLLTAARGLVLDVGTYVSLAFLLSKLFVGILTFVLLAFFGSLSGALLAAPLLYDRPGSYRVLYETTLTFAPRVRFVQDLWSVTVTPVFTLSEWNVDTLGEALVVAAFGLVVLVVSLHVLNAIAYALGVLNARVLRHARTLDV